MAASTVVLGLDGKCYRNTGTHGSPTWTEIENIKDLTCNSSFSEADVSLRQSPVKLTEPTLEDLSFDFDMVWDTSDVDFAAILAAKLARTSIEFLVLDGPQSTAGSQGPRVTCKVTSLNREETLEGVFMAKVTIKPCLSANAYEWYTAS